MYTCDACETTTAPGTRLHRIPEGLRVRRYKHRRDAQLARIRSKKKPVVKDDPGGIGFEWKGMLKVCPTCAKRYRDELEQPMLDEVEAKVDAVQAA